MAIDQDKTSVKDPVCGMTVDPASAKAKADHAGRTYYFCCTECEQKFQAAPEEYRKPKPSGLVTLGMPPQHGSHSPLVGISASPRPAPGTAYVCPLCPEVRESKLVPCPSCGMALEPETPVSSTKTECTCPMHPQIVRQEPGHRPDCGVALEPR